jgi:uncharacterized protein (TIGR02453 family)
MANTQMILSFLGELAKNNHKTWMDNHKDFYQAARQEFLDLTQMVLEQMKSFDEGLRELTVKDCVFRLNRDIRFSNDKTPYKTYFGAYMAEGGKKSDNPGYYLHLQPNGESMLGGGIYYPPNDILHKIRQEIDYNASELKQITDEPSFKKYFGQIQGEGLQRPPKGYASDHPNIDLLKLKSYFVIHKLSDEDILKPGFPSCVVNVFRAIRPLNEYLSVAIS